MLFLVCMLVGRSIRKQEERGKECAAAGTTDDDRAAAAADHKAMPTVGGSALWTALFSALFGAPRRSQKGAGSRADTRDGLDAEDDSASGTQGKKER